MLQQNIISLFILPNKRNNMKQCTASYQHNHRTARPSGEAHASCNNTSCAVKKQVTAGAIQHADFCFECYEHSLHITLRTAATRHHLTNRRLNLTPFVKLHNASKTAGAKRRTFSVFQNRQLCMTYRHMGVGAETYRTSHT